MATIPLTQGFVTIVDDEDYLNMNQWRWHVLKVEKLCYAARFITENKKPKALLMHRQILNAAKGMEVDHIDGDGLNNERSNLRLCNHMQNHYNLRIGINTSSQYKGVYWRKRNKKWHARISANGKRKSLGYFDNEVQAALVYNEAAKELHGEYARLNIVG